MSGSAIHESLERSYEVVIYSRPTPIDNLPSCVQKYLVERYQPNALKIAFKDFHTELVFGFEAMIFGCTGHRIKIQPI